MRSNKESDTVTVMRIYIAKKERCHVRGDKVTNGRERQEGRKEVEGTKTETGQDSGRVLKDNSGQDRVVVR